VCDAGYAPLTLAAEYNASPAVCRLLIEHGADASLRDLENKTAFDYATSEEVKTVLRQVRVPADASSRCAQDDKHAATLFCFACKES
jgi:ankyrin repeat protein